MKLLSSSSSVSSTNTASFDANLCNSKSATAGCLAGVLRRLLCSNSLPTYPSDQIRDPDTNSLSFLETEGKVTNREHPGLVARLMGLESMPKSDVRNTQVTPNSISRSRSMNSVDSGKELESTQRLHRRVKTSPSLREMPTFLELESEEFLVLSFENGGKTKESRSKAKRSDMVCREMKTRKTETCQNKRRHSENELESRENQEPNNIISDVTVNRRIYHKPALKISNNGKVENSANILLSTENSNRCSHVAVDAIKWSKLINHRENSGKGKSRKKKKKENTSVVRKVQAGNDPENSSPVSVLDFGESTIDPEAHTSDEDSSLTVSNSRRKLSTELENHERSSLSNTNSSASNDPKAKVFERKCNGSRKKDVQIQGYSDIWFEICKMAERELHESKWVYREMWKLEDFEDRVADLGSQVIEVLLNELVAEL